MRALLVISDGTDFDEHPPVGKCIRIDAIIKIIAELASSGVRVRAYIKKQLAYRVVHIEERYDRN